MSDSAAAVIGITVLTILFIADIVGNSLVCAIIKRNRDMRSPINYLLLSLAVADILFATFIAPNVFFIHLSFAHHPDGMTGTVLCILLTNGNVAWVGATSSIVNLAAIAIERYYVVMYPHDNKGKFTKGKLKVIIPGVWIFSLLLNIPGALVSKFDKESNSCVFSWPEKWMGQAVIVAWETTVVLTMALMIVLYSRVVYNLWFKRNDNSQQLTFQQQGVLKVRKRVTLMVVAVSVIFVICWGTDVVVYVIKDIISYNIGPVPVAIANTMSVLNSAVNPFVYALFNQQFREKIKSMLCCGSSSAHRVHPTPETQELQLTSNTSHQPQAVSSQE
ncbi:hypothetical protein ACROYT_G039012 [Oculina patagonica]